MPIVAPSSIKSHPVFLSMKEGTASRWGKDFNPSAFIQSSMLNQLDRDMLREVGLRVSMDCIARFMTRTWGIAEF